MESFSQLMGTIGALQGRVDFVASLPVEIAELVLTKLDPRSLLNVARVSRRWLAVCMGSSRLRKTTRRHLRKEKRRIVQLDLVSTRQSKSGSAFRTTRMLTNARTSQPGRTAPLIFKAQTTSTLNIRSSDRKSISRVPLIPTKSSLRLR